MQSERGTSGWWARSVVFLTIGMAFYLLSPSVADPDLWGHVRFGQLTWAQGSVLRVDPFSYLSTGQEWVNHEWLAEVVFAGLYEIGGGRALLLFKLGMALCVVGLIYRHLVREGLDALRAGLVLFAIVFLLVPGLTAVRPQIFTFVCFAITLRILYAAEMGRSRGLWFLPPLFALWINLHGGVLAGLGVVGLWGMGRGWTAIPAVRSRGLSGLNELRVPAAVVAGCTAALILNPYGAGLPMFLLRTGTVPRPDIVEWQALKVFSVFGVVYLAAVGAGVVAVVRSRDPSQLPLLLLFIVLALLPLSAVRHLQLFAIGFGVLLADRMASAWSRGPATATSSTTRLRPVAIGLAFGVGAMMVGGGVGQLECVRIDRLRAMAFPARAVDLIERSGVEGNLAVYFDWGEYALWHLAPEVRVSMDGRRETVYPDTIYDEYLRFQRGTGKWQDVLEKHPTDLVLFAKSWPTFNLMSLQPEWATVYEDSLAAIFAREDGPLIGQLRQTPVSELPYNGEGLCFP